MYWQLPSSVLLLIKLCIHSMVSSRSLQSTGIVGNPSTIFISTLLHQAPKRTQFVFSLLNIRLAFVVAILYINPIHQHHHLQQQLVAAAIAVLWAVFPTISSINWLSKPVDNETLIVGKRCTRASSQLQTSPKPSQQSTIPTKQTFNESRRDLFPQGPKKSPENQVRDGPRGRSNRWLCEGAARNLEANWTLALRERLLGRLARWTCLRAAMVPRPGWHHGSEVPILPARCATQR